MQVIAEDMGVLRSELGFTQEALRKADADTAARAVRQYVELDARILVLEKTVRSVRYPYPGQSPVHPLELRSGAATTITEEDDEVGGGDGDYGSFEHGEQEDLLDAGSESCEQQHSADAEEGGGDRVDKRQSVWLAASIEELADTVSQLSDSKEATEVRIVSFCRKSYHLTSRNMMRYVADTRGRL